MLLIWQIIRKSEALLLALEDVLAYVFPVPEHVKVAVLTVVDVPDVVVAALAVVAVEVPAVIAAVVAAFQVVIAVFTCVTRLA